MNCVCSKQNQWANMRKSPNIGKNRAILMPSLLKTAKSADSWRPSAERRKIQTLDQCFPRNSVQSAMGLFELRTMPRDRSSSMRLA